PPDLISVTENANFVILHLYEQSTPRGFRGREPERKFHALAVSFQRRDRPLIGADAMSRTIGSLGSVVALGESMRVAHDVQRERAKCARGAQSRDAQLR